MIVYSFYKLSFNILYIWFNYRSLYNFQLSNSFVKKIALNTAYFCALQTYRKIYMNKISWGIGKKRLALFWLKRQLNGAWVCRMRPKTLRFLVATCVAWWRFFYDQNHKHKFCSPSIEMVASPNERNVLERNLKHQSINQSINQYFSNCKL